MVAAVIRARGKLAVGSEMPLETGDIGTAQAAALHAGAKAAGASLLTAVSTYPPLGAHAHTLRAVGRNGATASMHGVARRIAGGVGAERTRKSILAIVAGAHG